MKRIVNKILLLQSYIIITEGRFLMNAHINVDKNICDLKCYESSYFLL